VEIRNEITLPLDPEQLFKVLLDVERVAPCIPGATLEGVEDDVYHASVKLKVGPITAAYKGTVRFLEVDEAARTAVMSAAGTEVRGQGKAEATIRASVAGDEHQSTLTMDTDLAIRGRLAQFGRGVISDVSENLMAQFAASLEKEILGPPAGESQPAGAEAPAGARPAAPPVDGPGAGAEADGNVAIGLGMLAGPVLRRLAPVAVAFAAGLVLGRRRSART
jgi:carbon monoxide dehydrogenase subunit G